MRIGIVYGHVASNIGDLAINRGVVGLLRRVVPDSEVHVVLLNPSEPHLDRAYESFSGIEKLRFSVLETRGGVTGRAARDRASLQRAHRYLPNPLGFLDDTGLRDCDAILYNSGEHLFSYGDRPASIDTIWRTLPAVAAAKAGIRFITLPATFGPFEASKTNALFRTYLALNDSFAAREPRSAEIVASFLGDSGPPVLLDPAFFAPAIGTASSSSSVATLGVVMRLEAFGLRVGTEASRRILQSHRESGYRTSTALRFAVAGISRFLDETEGRVKLFVQSSGNDRELTNAIADVLVERGHEDRIELVEPTSVADYQRELASVDLVLAARFHACILGVVEGKPVIGVHFGEHGHKMPGLFDLLGVPDYCLSLSEGDPEELAQRVTSLYRAREQEFESVGATVDRMRNETAEWLTAALSASRAHDTKPLRRRDVKAYRTALKVIEQGLPHLRKPSLAGRIKRKLSGLVPR